MEATSENMSNTVESQPIHSDQEQSVEIEKNFRAEKLVEKVSEEVKEDKKTDEDSNVAEQVATKEENSNSVNEHDLSSITEDEDIIELDDEDINESYSENDKTAEITIDTQTQKITNEKTLTEKSSNSTNATIETTTITKKVPLNTTIIMTPPTPTTEENHMEEKVNVKPLIKEVEKVKSSTIEQGRKVEKCEKGSEEKEVLENNVLTEQEECPVQIADEIEISKKAQVQQTQNLQQSDSKGETIIDSPSAAINTNQSDIQNEQDNLNNALKDIILTIDSNIEAEENIAALKERELMLIKKQQELAKEIQQQQLLAQELASKNRFEQHIINRFRDENAYPPTKSISKYSTYEEKQNENMYSRRSENYESRESTNVSKKIDLQKIFTPATDAEEIVPKNRKLYASSAFYSPTLHPTVEDQVELARRISHSLSDISNQQSRGQSMYVNRKKRSVKWVHEGCGQEKPIKSSRESLNQSENINDENTNRICQFGKVPLKFLMNPCGKILDINSLRESINTETGLLSPDVSVEVMTALQMQKGKGAELFAKRRKISEKWVVDENNIGAQSPSGLLDYHQNHQQSKPSTSPSILPAYTDAAKHRVQLNLHQDQLLEKYAKPALKVVQTPWEAALSSGSASTAFVEEEKPYAYSTLIQTHSPTPQIYDVSHQNLSTGTDIYGKSDTKADYQKYNSPTNNQLPQEQNGRYRNTCAKSQRELAYKPSIPQGWKAPCMSLPKDLYIPKDIPIQSYAPPPVTEIPVSFTPYLLNEDYNFKPSSTYNTSNIASPASYFVPDISSDTKKSISGDNTFPVNSTYQQGFSSIYGTAQPLKQIYLPTQSHQTVPQNSQNVKQVNFNPSPLPYDKLAKFENPPRHSTSPRNNYQLNVRANKEDTSPAPFGCWHHRPCTPSFEPYLCGVSPSNSDRLASSFGIYKPNPSHIKTFSNQILNAPTYNRLARGWGCSDSKSDISAGYQPSPEQILQPSKYQNIINAASVPYTDF